MSSHEQKKRLRLALLKDVPAPWDLKRNWQSVVALWEQAATAGLGDAAMQQNVQVLQQELIAAEAEIASVQADAVRYSPVAPYAGRVFRADPELQAGTWVRRQEPVLTLVKPGQWQVEPELLSTLLSFLNCEKYPPSLLYLAMTLGPALLLLAGLDARSSSGVARSIRNASALSRPRARLEWALARPALVSAGAASTAPTIRATSRSF